MAEGYISSGEYARRLGVDFSLFRQAMAYKRGALGTRGGTGYAAPQVRELAERIAPPTTSYSYGATERPLWSLRDVEAHEVGLRARGISLGGQDGGDAGRGPVRARRGGGSWPAALGGAGADPREISGAVERAGLSERERLVLERRYGAGNGAGAAGPDRGDAPGGGDPSSGAAPLTQRELAEELGMSQPRVSRLERDALAKVRAALADRITASEGRDLPRGAHGPDAVGPKADAGQRTAARER